VKTLTSSMVRNTQVEIEPSLMMKKD